MWKFLYRGVNINIHSKRDGLKPKGTKFTRQARHGEKYVRHGSGVQHGNSTVNAIIAHQTNSRDFPSSGISTTPHFEIAKKYVTYQNNSGVVYKIDVGKLSENDIEKFIVGDHVPYPNILEDDEVILHHKTDGRISDLIITEIIEVESEMD